MHTWTDEQKYVTLSPLNFLWGKFYHLLLYFDDCLKTLFFFSFSYTIRVESANRKKKTFYAVGCVKSHLSRRAAGFLTAREITGTLTVLYLYPAVYRFLKILHIHYVQDPHYLAAAVIMLSCSPRRSQSCPLASSGLVDRDSGVVKFPRIFTLGKHSKWWFIFMNV